MQPPPDVRFISCLIRDFSQDTQDILPGDHFSNGGVRFSCDGVRDIIFHVPFSHDADPRPGSPAEMK